MMLWGNAVSFFLVCLFAALSNSLARGNTSSSDLADRRLRNDVTHSSASRDTDAGVGDVVTTAATFNVTEVIGHGKSRTMRAWKYIQVAISFLGCSLNAVALAAFVLHGNGFTKELRILLAHQAFLDSALCCMGMIQLLQTSMWTTTWKFFDSVVCYVWHSQGLFWASVFCSVLNLVAVSFERFCAVCLVTSDFKFNEKVIKIIIVSINVSGAMMSFPMYIHFRWENGTCLPQVFFQTRFMQDHFHFLYSLIWLIMAWILPCVAFAFTYGAVIRQLIARNKNSNLGKSELVGVVQKRITMMAIVLTAVFFFFLGFDAIAFVLGQVDLADYHVGTPLQQTGSTLCLVNSTVNPMVYAVYMPRFRRAVIKTLSYCLPVSERIDPGYSGVESTKTSNA